MLLFPKLDQPSLGLSREYLIKGLSDKLVEAYHNYQVDTALIYGADETAAKKEMKEALDFETSLAKVKKKISNFSKNLFVSF